MSREQNRIPEHQRIHRGVDVRTSTQRAREGRELLAAAGARRRIAVQREAPLEEKHCSSMAWPHGRDTAQANGLPQGTHVSALRRPPDLFARLRRAPVKQ